jgi:hypothetical protein
MMLPFLPWCRIDRAYRVGDVTIDPYRGSLEGAIPSGKRTRNTPRTSGPRAGHHEHPPMLDAEPRVARHLEDRRDGLHELIHVDRLLEVCRPAGDLGEWVVLGEGGHNDRRNPATSLPRLLA